MKRTVQRLRGGFAVAFYDGPKRISRRMLKTKSWEQAKEDARLVEYVAPSEREQFVYFMQLQNTDAFVKIGIAARADSRARQFATALPYELKILKVCSGGAGFERALHSRHRSSHIRGEWFRPTAELLAEIDSLPAVPAKIRSAYRFSGT